MGDEDEAVRMATTLRVLFHDGPQPRKGGDQSFSLFTLIGAKNELQFLDTGIYEDKLFATQDAWALQEFGPHHMITTSASDVGLVVAGRNPSTGVHGWYAPLDTPRFYSHNHSAVPMDLHEFDYWWSTPLVQGLSISKKTFSRQNLVSIMANQDGGAHVDPSLDQDYQALNVDFLGIQVQPILDGGPPPDLTAPLDPSSNLQNNVAFASMRQIAHEACGALHRFLDTLPASSDNPPKILPYKPSNPTFIPPFMSTPFIIYRTSEYVEPTAQESEQELQIPWRFDPRI